MAGGFLFGSDLLEDLRTGESAEGEGEGIKIAVFGQTQIFENLASDFGVVWFVEILSVEGVRGQLVLGDKLAGNDAEKGAVT